METSKKIILSLCGGTGSWEEPYRKHPDIYDVRNITLPDYDVRTYKPPETAIKSGQLCGETLMNRLKPQRLLWGS